MLVFLLQFSPDFSEIIRANVGKYSRAGKNLWQRLEGEDSERVSGWLAGSANRFCSPSETLKLIQCMDGA